MFRQFKFTLATLFVRSPCSGSPPAFIYNLSAENTNFQIVSIVIGACDFAPFDFPPINFNEIKVETDCDFGIHVLRQPKKIEEYNYGKIIKKFEPRYQFPNIPLVFSHINPLIIVVENLNE